MKLERKSLTAALLSVFLIVTMMPLYTGEAYAEESDAEKAYNDVMQSNVPDSFRDESYEPYHFGKDVPFLMNRQSEILFYMTNKDSSGKITSVYDTLKTGNTEDIFKGAAKTTAIEEPPVDLKKAAFVQAVSFDPRGCGRDDHIAFIGVNSTKYAYVWVYDTRNKKWYRTSGSNGGFQLVKCAWMQSQDITDYEAANFLSITAGDYDGDGKDTIIAYAAGDYVSDSNKGEAVTEIKVVSPDVGSSGNITVSSVSSSTKYVWSEKFLNSNYEQIIPHKLGVDLDTGDIDGDGIDDLVTVCYYGNADNSNQKASLYRPSLCVMYGGRDNFLNTVGSRVGLWDGRNNESDDAIKNKNWKSLVSPSIAAGDIDNDGVDEIIAAGIKNTIHANGDANAGDPNDVDNSKLEVFIINDGKTVQKEISANAWTTKGFWTDEDAWSKTEVECVAVNGLGNPEMVFISGTLYDLMYNSESKDYNITGVCTPEYFNDGGTEADNLSFKASTNMFVQSAAAGNFNGNDKGFEQVVYVVSCKTSGSMNYDYIMGVIGGKNHNDMSGIASGYYSTSDGSMDDDNSWPTKRAGQSNRAGNIREDCGLNCVVVDIDNDNDGMLVRYKEKTFTYADPDIVCVLQAPPFFKELAEYTGVGGSTTYTITNSYSFESSTTTSSSFGVGGVVKLGTPACEIEVQAGYAREWSQEFTEAYENAESYKWTATTDDQVVVCRTPVISYKYQVQDQSGKWEDDGEDNSLIISVPEDPSYVPMSLETYNLFARYYNTETAKKVSSFKKMQSISNIWLGHEGEPEKYIPASNKLFDQPNNGYELIQKSFQNVAHTSGSTGWSLENGTSSSVTESMEYGFTFDASVGVGPDLGPVSFSVGVTTSLQNMSGSSVTTSKATINGIECDVDNIDDKSIPAKLKPNQFSFSYKMATWPSGIKRYVKGSRTTPIPVYGYALAGVYNPLTQGALTPEEIEALDLNGILDTLEDSSEITLDDEEDIKFARKLYDDLSEGAKKYVKIIILERAEEKIRVLKEFETAEQMDISRWEIVLDKTSFTYNGKAQKPVIQSIWGMPLTVDRDYEVSWSNEGSKNPGTYKVTVTGKGRYTGSIEKSYKIKKAGNTLSVKARSVKASASRLKKKAKTFSKAKYLTVKKPQGKLTYTKSGGSRKITVNKKTGKLTLKKGLKKGTYKFKVKVKAAGNKYYNALTKTVKVTVRVR